jgi:hypothetical protein
MLSPLFSARFDPIAALASPFEWLLPLHVETTEY